MTTVPKVGDRIRDNDWRMGDRVLTITILTTMYAYCSDGKRSGIRIRHKYIHTDGKPRKSGFSLIVEDIGSAGQ